jgi:hypothetical protein
MSPLADQPVGHPLHTITGMWFVEDYLGHCLYLVAAAAMVRTVLVRIARGDDLELIWSQWITRPATVVVPLMFGALALSGTANIERSSLYEVPPDDWLRIYWLLFCGSLIYLMVWAMRALLILRTDPRHRRSADLYLVLIAAAIAFCAARIGAQWFDPLNACFRNARLGWISTAGGGVAFALASGWSWKQKTRPQPAPTDHPTPTLHP